MSATSESDKSKVNIGVEVFIQPPLVTLAGPSAVGAFGVMLQAIVESEAEEVVAVSKLSAFLARTLKK